MLHTVQTDYATDNSGLPIRSTVTANASNQVMKTEWDYVNSLLSDNVSEQRDFDYASGTPGARLRKTDYTYLGVNPINNVDYTANNIRILNRKASEIVYAGSSTTASAQTQYEYDSYTSGLSASGAIQHSSSFGTGFTTRGNRTAVKRWRNTDNTFLTTRSQYDDAGNVLSATDPNGNTTTFSYADHLSEG